MNNVIIINAYYPHEDRVYKLNEILSLCKATDCEVKGYVDCKVFRVNPATFIGKGKVDQVKRLSKDVCADMIIFNGELSPSQTLNVADVTELPVITKTNLILDIFARRAISNEGKILVELAQLKYIYPRLKGKGDSLSRQGGGIGTVGPGETKLETDRRYIKGRIRSLEKSLKEIQKRQKLQQTRRSKNMVKTVAIVGYTNVGKSTLINKLCGSSVTELDQVFATLDPTARVCDINGEKVIFVDTVGFIKDLPESLVEAFKSTLEIAKTADLLLCVADVSLDFNYQKEVADDILNEIGACTNRIYALNKCDKEQSAFVAPEYIKISAKDGAGLNELKDKIYENLFGRFTEYSFEIPYDRSPVMEKIKKVALTLNAEYGEKCIIVSGKVNEDSLDKLKSIINCR